MGDETPDLLCEWENFATGVLKNELDEDVAADIICDLLSAKRLGFKTIEGAFRALSWTPETHSEHAPKVVSMALAAMGLPDNVTLAHRNGVRAVLSSLLQKLPKPPALGSTIGVAVNNSDVGTGGSGSGLGAVAEQQSKKPK